MRRFISDMSKRMHLSLRRGFRNLQPVLACRQCCGILRPPGAVLFAVEERQGIQLVLLAVLGSRRELTYDRVCTREQSEFNVCCGFRSHLYD